MLIDCFKSVMQEQAKDELDKSITALEGAVETMHDATVDHQEGVFLTSVRSKLQKVVKVGEGFMSKTDVKRLRKVLDVPESDWNELNKDATFKMKTNFRRVTRPSRLNRAWRARRNKGYRPNNTAQQRNQP